MLIDSPPLQWSPEPIVNSLAHSIWRLNTPPPALLERLDEQLACKSEHVAQQLSFCEATDGWWVYQQIEQQHWLSFYPRISQPLHQSSDAWLGRLIMTTDESGQILRIYQRHTSARQFVKFLRLRLKQRIQSIQYFTDQDIHIALGNPSADLFVREQGSESYLIWSQVDE